MELMCKSVLVPSMLCVDDLLNLCLFLVPSAIKESGRVLEVNETICAFVELANN